MGLFWRKSKTPQATGERSVFEAEGDFPTRRSEQVTVKFPGNMDAHGVMHAVGDMLFEALQKRLPKGEVGIYKAETIHGLKHIPDSIQILVSDAEVRVSTASFTNPTGNMLTIEYIERLSESDSYTRNRVRDAIDEVLGVLESVRPESPSPFLLNAKR